MTEAELRRIVQDELQRTATQASRVSDRLVESPVDPETVVDGSIGTLCIQTTAGTLWQKTTARGTLTGWVAR